MRGKIQQGLLTEDGKDLLEIKRPKSVNEVSIEVISEKPGESRHIKTKGKTSYSLELIANNTYTLIFSKPNYLDKVVEISTHGASEQFLSKKFELITDITLYKAETNEKLDQYTKAPVALCKFDKKRNTMIWDMKHAQKSFRAFIEIISEEEKQKIIVSNPNESHIDPEKEIKLINEMTRSLNSYHHILLAKFESKNKLDEPVPAEASAE